jgi:hypothetical protein
MASAVPRSADPGRRSPGSATTRLAHLTYHRRPSWQRSRLPARTGDDGHRASSTVPSLSVANIPEEVRGERREDRIEGLLFLCFVALLVQALLEREVRQAMAREGIEMLPFYPEEREGRAPSTERILRLLEPLQRHRLRDGDNLIQTFTPTLSALQSQLLQLMGLPAKAFTAAT